MDVKREKEERYHKKDGKDQEIGAQMGVNALKKGGPKGGCWQCGGAHYAQHCPKGKGKSNPKR